MDNMTKSYIAAEAYKTIEDLLDKPFSPYINTLEIISDVIDIMRAMNDTELNLLTVKEQRIDNNVSIRLLSE